MPENEKEKTQATAALLQEEKARIKTPGKFLIPIGWILIVLSVLVNVSIVQGPHQRNSYIEAFLNHPDSVSLGGTIGFIIGINLLTLPAMLFGIYTVLRKNPKGKLLVIASIFLFVIVVGVQFLPSPISDRNVDTSQAASEIVRELRAISKDDVIKEFVEKIDNAPTKYTSDKDGFSVTFPSQPTLTKVTGDIQTVMNYQAYSSDGLVSYNVFLNYLAKKLLSDESQKAFLDSYLAGKLLISENSRVITDNQLVFRGFNGRNYEYIDVVEGVDILRKGIVFIIDGDSVSLTMVHPNAVVPDYSFDKFVASFNLMPLAPQLKEEPWEDKVLGLRIRPPTDMDVYKTNNPKTGLIVIFSNKAGHSLGIFDVSVLYPNMTTVDVERELASMEKDLDGWYRIPLSNPSTTTEMVQLTKILEHGSKIYMVQGYGPAKTLFRSELKFKKAADSLTFIRD